MPARMRLVFMARGHHAHSQKGGTIRIRRQSGWSRSNSVSGIRFGAKLG